MPEPVKPTQLPFDLALKPGYTRDELVVTPANAAAVAMVDRWPDWPSTAVLLAGPGKITSRCDLVRRRAGAARDARDDR
jgi:hypothetical protein